MHTQTIPETTSEQRALDRRHRDAGGDFTQRRARRDPAWRIARRSAAKRAR